MFFYRIDVRWSDECRKCLESEIQVEVNQRESFQNQFYRKLRRSTADWNDLHENKMYFVSELYCDGGILGFVSKWEPFHAGDMEDYLEKIGLEITDAEIQEIPLGDIVGLFRRAERTGNDLVNEQFSRIVSLYGISKRSGGFEYREIMARLTEDDVFTVNEDERIRNGRKQYVSRSLDEELERIRSMNVREEWIGHPVHYLIETDDEEFQDYAVQSLMRALYRQKRITSRKYMGLFMSGASEHALDAVYRFCERGCIFLCIGRDEDDDSPYACADMRDILLSAKWMKEYRNRTLTVFMLPKSCNKIKELLFENTAGCTFVEITEDTLSGEKAKNYLRAQAEENHAEADAHLYENLEEKESYLPKDLKEQFERWLGGHLKHSVYPAYADLACTEIAEAGKEPQGEAYDKLQKMIGLDEAKRVIDEALNYYKVQKMFKERGFAESHPVMHMVFAGSPGTAKTTVARLFAQIMKDNGLLSEGKLYEVGRADLVGQYVGWTAKQVKEAFKKAKGSVLFIDEAYSLVDDRKGMYGDEAINTIVQEMENNSKDMVVILAGYPDEMEELIGRNPGLRSRIAFHVPFEDYDEEELYGITKLIAEEKGLRLSSGVKKKLMPIFAEARGTEDFGNGRYVRNMVEKAQMRQASRLIRTDVEAVTDREIATLRAEDFEAVRLGRREQKHAIGF